MSRQYGPGPGPGRGPMPSNGDLWYGYGDPIAQSDHKTEGHQISKSSKLGLLIVGLIWVAVIVICAVTGITR